MKDHVRFHLPTKPYSLVDAINRMAAATGSMRYAMATGDADYNGHHLALYWNDYRGYYVCDYHWGERVVLVRDADFARALRGAKLAFASQGRGASLRISARPQDAHIAESDPEVRAGEEPKMAWRTWQFDEVGFAVKHGWTHHLIAATDPDDYRRRLGLPPIQRAG